MRWYCTLFTIFRADQMTLPRGNVAMSSTKGTNLLYLEHYEDSDPWSPSSASSDRESLEATLDIDYTDEVFLISGRSILHNVKDYSFILKTALRHLVPSFMPSPRCSSHALSLKRRRSYLDGLHGVAAIFVFRQPLPYRATSANTHALQLPTIQVFYSGSFMVNTFVLSATSCP